MKKNLAVMISVFLISSLLEAVESIPYQCEKCGYWHLAPTSSKLNVQRNACSCLDSNRRHKALYLTREDAEKQRMKSEAEQHISLKIYSCNEGKGFHLTHCF